jgi:hypothetical protein
MILAVIGMKLKAERVTFKYCGPVQRRDWLESPPAESAGFSFAQGFAPAGAVVVKDLLTTPE